MAVNGQRKIEMLATTALKPYEKNARTHSAEQIEKICRSIQEFGFINPVLIDEKQMIVAGHGRVMAAQKLGMEKVPCLRIKGLTETQIRAYILADNKLAEDAGWDDEILRVELEELKELDFDITIAGFDVVEIEEEPEVFEDEVPEQVESRCKLGDVWILGNHRLICGDSTDVNVIEKLMDGQTADLVYTDPPYGMNAVSKSGVLSERYKTDIMNDDDNTVAIDAFNMSKAYFADVKQVWWGANYYTECIPSSECWLVWDKNNGGSDQTDCELAYTNFRSVVRQFTMVSEKTNRVHPTQKPVKLFAEIIKKFDKTNSVKNVVDLFGGSGSTLVACEQLGKKCFTCELDTYYCDVILRRWENLTGGHATLLKEVKNGK